MDTQKPGRGYLRFLLVSFTAASVVLNGAHAGLKAAGALEIGLAAAVAAVPPLALLAATHAVIVLMRVATGRIRWVVVVQRFLAAILAVVGTVAFAASFRALADMGEMMHMSPGSGWMLPTIIDAVIVIATVGLVVVQAEADAAGVEEVAEPAGATSDSAVAPDEPPVALGGPPVVPGGSPVATAGSSSGSSVVPGAGEERHPGLSEDKPRATQGQPKTTLATAAENTISDKPEDDNPPLDDEFIDRVRDAAGTTVEAAKVGEVIRLNRNGFSQRRISDDSGVSRSVVGRIIRAVADLETGAACPADDAARADGGGPVAGAHGAAGGPDLTAPVAGDRGEPAAVAVGSSAE